MATNREKKKKTCEHTEKKRVTRDTDFLLLFANIIPFVVFE